MQRPEGWRSQHAILVPEARALGTIAVIRSLGRAGFRVHACADDPRALGLRSNYAAATAVHPPYRDVTFLEWLRRYVKSHGISVIVPSEGFLHAIKPCFDEFALMIPVSNDATVVYRALSKIDTLEALQEGGTQLGAEPHLPPGVIVSNPDDAPSEAELSRLGGPFYIKSDPHYARRGYEALLRRVEDIRQVSRALDESLRSHRRVLLQGYVPGRKAAAAFCIKDGEVLARSGVLGIRTTPHTGGMMSLRISESRPDLSAKTEAWLQYLRWEGVAMMECKWDPETDHVWFIELNARFWGYLHLDLLSGVDMPRILVDAFLGHPPGAPPVQRLGVVTRHTIPGDVGAIASYVRDPTPSIASKISAVTRFFADGFRPSIQPDLLFPGDRKLYWIQWRMFLSEIIGRAFGRHS